MEIKGLFEGGSLTPETQKAIEESFQAALVVKEAELATQYEQKLTEAKQELSETMMQLVNESIEEEMQEILEEVKHARTLEVQYAEKLQTFKDSYAQKTDETMKLMVTESIQEELSAIAEEVEMIKKYEFVMGIFEQFKGTYERLFGGMDIDVVEALEESRKELATYKRKEAIDNLLEGLTGSKKEVARTILESVETDKLEEKFNSVKHILLAETAYSIDATLNEGYWGQLATGVGIAGGTGAAVGAAMAGPAGAVLGGVTGGFFGALSTAINIFARDMGISHKAAKGAEYVISATSDKKLHNALAKMAYAKDFSVVKANAEYVNKALASLKVNPTGKDAVNLAVLKNVVSQMVLKEDFEISGTVVLENELVEEKGEGEVVTESATIDPVALKLQRSLKLAKSR